MYKSFILPHFDYSDAVWDNCTNELSEQLEQLNLDAIRTVIGAVRGTSHQKLYEESGFIPLKERRSRHKLIIFYKMVNGLAPKHLTDCLPPLVSISNPYHIRNPLERKIPPCRLEFSKRSFFPSTTVEWNALPDSFKLANSLSQFKRFLKLKDVVVPRLYYNDKNRFVEIIHCKIRLEISDLNNHLFKRHLRNDSVCACGYKTENTKHYFFDCPLYIPARTSTIHTIPNLRSLTIKALTHGDNSKTFADNSFFFKKVQEFIVLSNRFK